jgi:hypothetical protein
LHSWVKRDNIGLKTYAAILKTNREVKMSETEIKPLNFTPSPDIGYTVVRRPDGGMHFTFTALDAKTLEHWREFALQHLYDSDRLVRNLYDITQVETIPAEAVRFAVEANSDPASRNIRLAVVVANEEVRSAILEISALTPASGAEMAVFTSLEKAEAWLNRPLTTMI